jgi:hypothetical protein
MIIYLHNTTQTPCISASAMVLDNHRSELNPIIANYEHLDNDQ